MSEAAIDSSLLTACSQVNHKRSVEGGRRPAGRETAAKPWSATESSGQAEGVHARMYHAGDSRAGVGWTQSAVADSATISPNHRVRRQTRAGSVSDGDKPEPEACAPETNQSLKRARRTQTRAGSVSDGHKPEPEASVTDRNQSPDFSNEVRCEPGRATVESATPGSMPEEELLGVDQHPAQVFDGRSQVLGGFQMPDCGGESPGPWARVRGRPCKAPS